MGMYDDLRCHYPLPVKGANERGYQTKDTPCQYLNKYEITAEGVLRHQEWDADEGLNEKWIGHPDFIGEIRFYDYKEGGGWIEWSAYFVNGLLEEVHLIDDRPGARQPAEQKDSHEA
jgi:hypothetical protein